MGCQIPSKKNKMLTQQQPPKTNVKRPSIDCRKKSSVAPDLILENVTVKSDKVTDSQLRNFAADVLHSHNLFSDLSPNNIQEILNFMFIVETKKDERVFEEGDMAACFFLITDGQAEVYIGNEVIRTIGRGSCFGELALIYYHNRSASIEVISEKLTMLCLKARHFKLIMQKIKKQNIKLCRELVENVQIFSLLSTKQKYKLATNLIKENYRKGQILFKEGEIPYSFYIVLSGKVQIHISKSRHQRLIIGRLQSFGESVFKPNGRRQGTAIVVQDLVCFTINQNMMKQCIGETVYGIIFQNIKKWSLKQSKVFDKLTGNQLDFLALKFRTKFAKKSQVLCQKGEKQQKILICLEGRINNKSIGTMFNDNNYQQWLKSNKTFVQNDIIKNDDGAYAEIQFEEIRERVSELKKLQNVTNKQRVRFDQTQCYKKTHNLLKDSQLKIGNLVYLKKLGEGQFGNVYLVKDNKTEMLYAVKVLSKKLIKEEQMQQYVVAQREILETVDHPMIVGFYEAFHDDKNVYFFMEYLNGVEMFEAIREIGILTKKIATYYFGSILLAIESLHEKNIIYRDIKPENSIITYKGKVILIDLGTCKRLSPDNSFRTATIIGTPHYMAPEVMSGKGYSFEVDFWSMGILLYEFVCGKLPFAESCDKPYQIYSQIMKGSISFPRFVNDVSVKKLILQLLNPNPNKRTTKNTFDDIRDCPYFSDFKWDSLRKDKITAPYIPKKLRKGIQQQFENIPLAKFISDGDKHAYRQQKWKKEKRNANSGQGVGYCFEIFRDWSKDD